MGPCRPGSQVCWYPHHESDVEAPGQPFLCQDRRLLPCESHTRQSGRSAPLARGPCPCLPGRPRLEASRRCPVRARRPESWPGVPSQPCSRFVSLQPLESWALPSDLSDLRSGLVLRETEARAAGDSAELTAGAGGWLVTGVKLREDTEPHKHCFWLCWEHKTSEAGLPGREGP